MIIFVGDKPSPRMKLHADPFEGAYCQQRLIRWMVETMDVESNESYSVINQCDWAYQKLSEWHKKGYKFVALGNNASEALKTIPHFKLPHPSGKNRQINSEAFINDKLQACKIWLKSKKK